VLLFESAPDAVFRVDDPPAAQAKLGRYMLHDVNPAGNRRSSIFYLRCESS
jgi:hypothetical protein